MMDKKLLPHIELEFKHWQLENKELYAFLQQGEAVLAEYQRSPDFKLSVFLELMEYYQRK